KCVSRIWVGSMGKNGRKRNAPAMLNMLPKFELVPINRYFITLPKERRPSRMPAWRTPRSRSSRMMSAASLATSTAVATDTPTSAVWMEGASLMPSPRNPTTWSRLLSARMIRFFCAGETRKKSRLLGHRRERAVGHPLDLVATDDAGTVEADLLADVLRDELVVAGADLHHSSRSSRAEYTAWSGTTAEATARTRDPRALSSRYVASHRIRIASSSGARRSSASEAGQQARTPSGAPFVIRRRPSLFSTTTERRRRSKSNGISSTFR